MLPRFPKAQAATDEAWQKRMFDKLHEVFPSEIHPPVQEILEGKSCDFQRDDRKIKPLKLKLQTAVTHFDTSSGKGATLDILFRKAEELGESIGKQKWEMLTKAVDEAVEETGQTVATKKGDLRQEDILRLLEMGEQNYDELGNPLSQLICGTQFAEELERKQLEWKDDLNFHRKVAEINQRQKEKFYAREACRRLVE